jgi:hypothetical protein
MFVTFHPDGGVLSVPEAEHDLRLLTPAELGDVIAEVNRLNPYDRQAVPSLLKHEYADRSPLLALSIGPKRCCLLTSDGEMVARSESALGAIMPPTNEPDWISTWWQAIAQGTSLPFPEVPLVRKHSVQTWETLRHFRKLNEAGPYQAQVKPFNFLMTAQPDPLLAGPDASPLVAPFDADPESWIRTTWFETHTGRSVSITLDPSRAADASNEAVCVQSIAAYYEHYRNYLPSEFRLPEGGLPGFLRLRPVRRASLTPIGKESNALAELAEAGLVDPNPSEFGQASSHWIGPLRPVLADMDPKALAEQVGVSPRTVRRWADGTRRPDDRLRSVIESACVGFAAEVLEASGVDVPDHTANVVALYASTAPELRQRVQRDLRALVEQSGGRDVARRLGVDRQTIRYWVQQPDRIPLSGALLKALL